jgi:hypothetical protein
MAKNNKLADKKAAAVQTTVKVNSKVAEAVETIKATQPHVKTAYFNADGEYHFHKRPGFKAVPIQDDEEEVNLEAEIGDNEPDEDEPVDTGGKLEF